MCIVIDVNTFSHVFNVNSKEHAKCKPVRDWIHAGKGRVVYGGTKYWKELSVLTQYQKMFRLLKDAGRAVEVRKDLVDYRESVLSNMTQNEGMK